MIVRRYHGASEEEAIGKAHRELGSGAVVLLSKKLDGASAGERHEVVAAVSLMTEQADADDPSLRNPQHVDDDRTPQRPSGAPSVAMAAGALSR